MVEGVQQGPVLVGTFSTKNSYKYKGSKIALSIAHPIFLTKEWNEIYNSPIYGVM